MHVSKNFVEDDGQIVPNYDLYLKNIGRFPDRIRNLYFLYSLILKAVKKAEPLVSDQFPENSASIEKIILEIRNQCDDPFKESYFF